MPVKVGIFCVILIYLHSVSVSDSDFKSNICELFKIVGGIKYTRFLVSLLDSPKEDLFVSILLVATLCNLSCYCVLKNHFFLHLSFPM